MAVPNTGLNILTAFNLTNGLYVPGQGITAARASTMPLKLKQEVADLYADYKVHTHPQLLEALDCNNFTFNKSSYRQGADIATSGYLTVNYANYDMIQIQATGNLTFAGFAGFPSGKVSAMIIDAINWGNYTITHGALLFTEGDAPDYTSNGTDRLLVVVDKDAKVTVTMINKDLKA